MMSWRKTSCFVNSRSNEAWIPTHTSTIPSACSHFPYTPHALYPWFPFPPQTSLPFPPVARWTKGSIFFSYSGVKLVLMGWLDDIFWMPEEPRECLDSHTLACQANGFNCSVQPPRRSVISTQYFWDLCKTDLNWPLDWRYWEAQLTDGKWDCINLVLGNQPKKSELLYKDCP